MIKIHDEEAGLIKVSVSMRRADRMEPVADKKIDDSEYFNMRNSNGAGRIVIDLISAESLIASDDDGSVDPYFTFSYMSSEATSSKKNSTLNPIYF